MMLEKGGCLSSAKAKVEEVSSRSSSLDSTLTITHRKKKKNKKRFSDEQIKSMETMFETESKLEPKTKLQLAKELDLQPRQVAIWFQNRRARWKSKQLERDYNLLKASYDALASQFESMKKEKQMLQKQLQKLNDLRQRNHKEESSRTCQLSLDGNSTDDGDSDNGVSKYEPGGGGGGEEKPELSFGGSELKMGAYSDDENNNHNMYHLGSGGEEQEVDLMSVMDPAATNSMISSPVHWSAYDDAANNAPLFDQSSGNTSQWWEIWS